MRLVLVFLTCICISFSAPQNALSLSTEDIYGSWILTDVENNIKEEGWIGIMKLYIDKDLLTFDYGRYKDEGRYSLSNDTLKFISNRRRKETIYEFSFQDRTLQLIAPKRNRFVKNRTVFIFTKGLVPPFKINSAVYDKRFSSPEKTYALFWKRIQEKNIAEAVECFFPTKAGSYYKTFKMMGKRFDSFSENLPENITRKNSHDKYYEYWIERREDGRVISHTVVFLKTRNDIYLIFEF